ncbi:MAG: hypothetical protein EBX52_00780 [Proteobacteria bacterium]|nr:hypothetical protein [Pseudomonadota bacterium]
MTHAHKIFVRTRKEDSALLYHLLEAHEGLVSYSTLPHQKHDAFRDLELLVTEDLRLDLELLLGEWSEWVQILPAPGSGT